jgi:hypothetical protein
MALVDLGTTVVLDAHNLKAGMYVRIEKEVFIVDRIVDGSRVVLRPLPLWQRVIVWISDHKVLVIFSLVFLIVLGIMFIRSKG